jgi:hypothetical protein
MATIGFLPAKLPSRLPRALPSNLPSSLGPVTAFVSLCPSSDRKLTPASEPAAQESKPPPAKIPRYKVERPVKSTVTRPKSVKVQSRPKAAEYPPARARQSDLSSRKVSPAAAAAPRPGSLHQGAPQLHSESPQYRAYSGSSPRRAAPHATAHRQQAPWKKSRNVRVKHWPKVSDSQ